MTEEPASISLRVEGMTCNHCASTVEGILSKNGAKQVHVDYLLGEASFSPESDIAIEKVIAQLNNAGYSSRLGSGADAMLSTGKSKIEKRFWFTLPFTLVLFSHMLFAGVEWLHLWWVQCLLAIPVLITGWLQFGKSSYEAFKVGTTNMDVLILIGSSAAFFYSLLGPMLDQGATHHHYLFYETTATIITLVLLGYLIEEKAVKKTSQNLRDLMNTWPAKAKRLVKNGLNQDIEVVDSKSLKAGDLVLVNTGDRVPADGLIVYGSAQLNESMISGESDLIEKTKDSEVLSGGVLESGSFAFKVTRAGSSSTLGQIIQLVKQSRSSKPPIQKLADRISSVFVPSVLIAAMLTFGLNYLFTTDLTEALLRSIAVLVVACPCAMGLATPTAVSVGLGVAARHQIIVKEASAFEAVDALKFLVLDKTGTLTHPSNEIKLQILDPTADEALLWQALQALERGSSHPIALAVQSKADQFSPLQFDTIEEIKGQGIKGLIGEEEWRVGKASFATQVALEDGLYLSKNGKALAKVQWGDLLQAGAAKLVSDLKTRKVMPYLISGDSEEKVAKTASEVGIEHFMARQSPEMKYEHVVELQKSGKVGMIGDGINDAPALSKAHIGISLGNTNALAADASKVVILPQKIELVGKLFKISDRVVKTIRQNLFWAFAYNLIAIPLAATGYLSPMVAALSMAFSDVIVIGNSLRLRLMLPKSVK